MILLLPLIFCPHHLHCFMNTLLKYIMLNVKLPHPKSEVSWQTQILLEHQLLGNITQLGYFDAQLALGNLPVCISTPYPPGLRPSLHAPLTHQTHSKPTQVPFSLAFCPRPTHPSDPIATGPLPRPPLHPLTPHLLTHCPTLLLALFATSANHHPRWAFNP